MSPREKRELTIQTKRKKKKKHQSKSGRMKNKQA